MLWLIGLGAAAIALFALSKKEGYSRGQTGGNAWSIMLQSPAPIQASGPMIATALGIDANQVVDGRVDTPQPGFTVVTILFKPGASPRLPGLNTTINMFGVPATVRQVQPAPVG